MNYLIVQEPTETIIAKFADPFAAQVFTEYYNEVRVDPITYRIAQVTYNPYEDIEKAQAIVNNSLEEILEIELNTDTHPALSLLTQNIIDKLEALKTQ